MTHWRTPRLIRQARHRYAPELVTAGLLLALILALLVF